MSEWTFLIVFLCASILAFIYYYRLVRKFELLRKYKLYLPFFYLSLIIIGIVLHHVFSNEIIGRGWFTFSLGQAIGIFTSLPGFFAIAYAQHLFKFDYSLFIFDENNGWYWLLFFVPVNFVIYWGFNLILGYFYDLLRLLKKRMRIW